MFQNLINGFKLIIQEAAPPKIFKMIMKGDNLFGVTTNLLHVSTGIVQVVPSHSQNKPVVAMQTAVKDIKNIDVRAKIGYIKQLMMILRL